MTLTITRVRLAIVVLAVALIAPATALATHVFDDVPDGTFYSDAVDWAAVNGITTGKSPTSFAPNDGVTRGEVVTFLKRFYDTFVVGPSPIPKGGVVPGDGIWLIGTEVIPGTYRTVVPADSFGCYFARLSGLSGSLDDIIQNDNWSAGATVTVSIDESDVAFESSRCGTWQRI